MKAPFNRYKVSNPSRDRLAKPISIRERETDIYIDFNEGARLESISQSAYNSPSYWWIILAANPQYDMEYHIEPGDTIRVPLPLNDVVREIREQL